MPLKLNYFLFLFLLWNSIWPQTNIVDFVNLDETILVKIGDNIPIASKFSNLPIVEPHISAHPLDNYKLVAAAMVVTNKNNPYESCRLSSFYSNDGGLTWKETLHDFWGYDPWTAILSDGSTCMSWLGTLERFKGMFPLNIFTSSNSGKQWNKNVQTFNGLGHGHDGTKIAGFNNTFYLTTVRFNNNMSADVVLYASKNKEAFEEVAIVHSNGMRLNFCEPAILTNGNVIIPTMHYQGKIWVQIFNPTTKQLSEKYVISDNPKLGRGYSRMASDTNLSSKFRDRIYFVRAVAEGGSSIGVWLNYSLDGGVTWTKEKRIDLFDNELRSKANVPSIAVNKDGVIGVSWVDGQHSQDQKSYDVYFAASKDGGVSFSKPQRVTKVSSNPRTESNADVSNKFQGGGHYLGLCSKSDGSFQLIWSDSRNGHFQLQTGNAIVQ